MDSPPSIVPVPLTYPRLFTIIKLGSRQSLNHITRKCQTTKKLLYRSNFGLSLMIQLLWMIFKPTKNMNPVNFKEHVNPKTVRQKKETFKLNIEH